MNLSINNTTINIIVTIHKEIILSVPNITELITEIIIEITTTTIKPPIVSVVSAKLYSVPKKDD